MKDGELLREEEIVAAKEYVDEEQDVLANV